MELLEKLKREAAEGNCEIMEKEIFSRFFYFRFPLVADALKFVVVVVTYFVFFSVYPALFFCFFFRCCRWNERWWHVSNLFANHDELHSFS